MDFVNPENESWVTPLLYPPPPTTTIHENESTPPKSCRPSLEATQGHHETRGKTGHRQ